MTPAENLRRRDSSPLSDDWPGNLSEFNLVLRVAWLSHDPAGGEIRPEDLDLHLEPPPSLAEAEAEAEPAEIQRTMAYTHGNLMAAVRVLGIDRTTL